MPMSAPASANAAACSATAPTGCDGVVPQVHRPLDGRRDRARSRAHRSSSTALIAGPLLDRRPSSSSAARSGRRCAACGSGRCRRSRSAGAVAAPASARSARCAAARTSPSRSLCSWREQQDERLDALVEAVEALLERRERDAVRVALLLVPPRADAEVEAAVGDDVDRSRPCSRAPRDGGRSSRSPGSRCGCGGWPAPSPRASSTPRGTDRPSPRRSDRSGRSSTPTRTASMSSAAARRRASRPRSCVAVRS